MAHSKEYDRNYYLAHKEQARQYYLQHREERLAYQRRYNADNREVKRIKAKVYYDTYIRPTIQHRWLTDDDRQYIIDHPEMTLTALAQHFGCCRETIANNKRKYYASKDIATDRADIRRAVC